ncbi:hypothetical protein JTE90_021990 [Oedothorax gibbosus]|uniref:Uncharacterized protein n=1 Tax=Oedothorax gibbosus TaxID=931172 RepID=A0AAV6U645_9ARAC|nr:hypothetical protein JTE90_021990 [Oedothorax gibbosus]
MVSVTLGTALGAKSGVFVLCGHWLEGSADSLQQHGGKKHLFFLEKKARYRSIIEKRVKSDEAHRVWFNEFFLIK